MKSILTILLLVATLTIHAQELHLPFSGRWFVMAGGDTPNVNHHMAVQSQWYAIDFMKVGGSGQRSLQKSDGKTLEDYYSWDEPVLSPADGVIESVMDGLPDNPLGVKDSKNVYGNHVVIKIGADRFVFIAHLQKKSVAVKAGEHIKAGQVLGKCGNSGHSDYPHVHMDMKDVPVLNQGTGQNMIFKGINVELTGKQFENVDWPLICGLFVSNK